MSYKYLVIVRRNGDRISLSAPDFPGMGISGPATDREMMLQDLGDMIKGRIDQSIQAGKQPAIAQTEAVCIDLDDVVKALQVDRSILSGMPILLRFLGSIGGGDVKETPKE